MNTPNKLTVARMIATPVFMALLLFEFPHHYLAALILFIGASLTDLIDGKLARKNNMITDFGKFLDPLADKMLTTAAFLGFIEKGIGHGITWIAFIVLLREFLITSLRLISAGRGKVIAANMWGKCKTVSQMIAIIFVLASQYLLSVVTPVSAVTLAITVITDVVLWVSAALTVISGLTYVKENKQFIDPKK